MWRIKDSLIEQIGLDLFFYPKRRERKMKEPGKKKLRANEKNVS